MISISFVEDQDDLHHELKSKEPFAHPCLVIKKNNEGPKKRSGACADNYRKRKLPKIKSTQGKLKLNERNKHKIGKVRKNKS